MQDKVVIMPVSPQDTLVLRHASLRPHLTPEACVYPGDDTVGTTHLGAEHKGELVMRLRDEMVEARGNGIRCAVADGFNVHAVTTVAPLARDHLERLCK